MSKISMPYMLLGGGVASSRRGALVRGVVHPIGFGAMHHDESTMKGKGTKMGKPTQVMEVHGVVIR